MACAWRMIRKKTAPHAMRGVQRFSERITRKQGLKRDDDHPLIIAL